MADKEMDLVQLHAAGDYGSEFEYDSEADRKRARRQDLANKAKPTSEALPSSQEAVQEYDREEGRKMRYHILSMDAYSRHKKYINDYLLYFGGSKAEFTRDTSRDKRDIDVIREHHRFLWTDDDNHTETWEKRLSKKYYDKLYKEYCITDLSRYKENKIAMRWRIENEVVLGKGQFECGNRRCAEKEGLRTWEVNFGYLEHGEKKNALVKLRLCPECSCKLNYHHKKREVTQTKRRKHVEEERQKRLKTDLSGSASRRPGVTVSPREGTSGDPDDSHTSRSGDPAMLGDPSSSGDPDKDGLKSGDPNTTEADPNNPWSGPVKISEEKSREEEFEDYFEDMFM